MMNGLDFDTHAEEQAVELFATNILEAGKQFWSAHWTLRLCRHGPELSALYPTSMSVWCKQLRRITKSFQFGGASGWSERASPLFNGQLYRSVVGEEGLKKIVDDLVDAIGASAALLRPIRLILQIFGLSMMSRSSPTVTRSWMGARNPQGAA